MASNATAASGAFSSLPPDLFDTTTLVSLAAVLALLSVAYLASLLALPRATTPGSRRALFIWHAFDALIHFVFEGSYLYHCFTSWVSVDALAAADLGSGKYYFLLPHAFLGQDRRLYGPQAGTLRSDFTKAFADLWLVYARADKRWSGADLGVISLELLTVFVVGPMAVLVCVDLARGRLSRANILMVVIATAEIYGGFMTFCPEWLVRNANLDGSNFMYMWVYLVFFNMLWVFIPAYALYVACTDIADAFAVRAAVEESKKEE